MDVIYVSTSSFFDKPYKKSYNFLYEYHVDRMYIS